MENISEEPKRNVRAEWEALQEYAKGENWNAKNDVEGELAEEETTDTEMSAEERERLADKERKRKIGRRLLEAVELLSARADDEKLAGRIDRAMKMAERAGIREDAERSMKSHMKNDFESPAMTVKQAEREELRKIEEGESIEERKVEYAEKQRRRAETAERLKESAIELKGADLSGEFPSGNYLFHSSDVRHLEKLFESGSLMNALAIQEKTGDAFASANSGGEGISWSMNGIDALPGTRGHIAGFLAAPETILGGDKLVIPTRPAPYEVLQVSGSVDQKEFFETKKQIEVWGTRAASFGDLASVDTNLIFLGMGNSMFATSQMLEYQKRGVSAEELRKHFTVEMTTEEEDDGEGGKKIVEKQRIRLDEQLHQQKDDEKFIPPGAVYLQSLIDRGLVKEILGSESSEESSGEGSGKGFVENEKAGKKVEEMDVSELISLLKEDKEARVKVIRAERAESNEVYDKYNAEWEKVKGIEVPISEMYFVCSHADLPAWTKMMAKSEVRPKGILLYEDSQVVLPNFATANLGNHVELTQEIDGAVKADKEFWRSKMGLDVENLERAGSQGQVLREEDVSHDQQIRVQDGELVVEG